MGHSDMEPGSGVRRVRRDLLALIAEAQANKDRLGSRLHDVLSQSFDEAGMLDVLDLLDRLQPEDVRECLRTALHNRQNELQTNREAEEAP